MSERRSKSPSEEQWRKAWVDSDMKNLGEVVAFRPFGGNSDLALLRRLRLRTSVEGRRFGGGLFVSLKHQHDSQVV